jgi:hypothetical protein
VQLLHALQQRFLSLFGAKYERSNNKHIEGMKLRLLLRLQLS